MRWDEMTSPYEIGVNSLQINTNNKSVENI
jgi:hypothetical protein